MSKRVRKNKESETGRMAEKKRVKKVVELTGAKSAKIEVGFCFIPFQRIAHFSILIFQFQYAFKLLPILIYLASRVEESL